MLTHSFSSNLSSQSSVILHSAEEYAVEVRCLSTVTVASLLNRLFKPHFPPQRLESVCMRLVAKGIVSPRLSQQQIAALPQHTLEYLARQVVVTSLSIHTLSEEMVERSVVLTLIAVLEDVMQYQQSRIVAEDLAMLELKHQGGLHGYYFQGEPTWETLKAVLQSESYVFPEKLGDVDSMLMYWLCRRLGMGLPWAAICHAFQNEDLTSFPYLARVVAMDQFLRSHAQQQLPACGSWKGCVAALPKLRQWITQEFVFMAQAVNIAHPRQRVVLVEGNTEEIVIPAMANVMGIDLNQYGIAIQSVGGKNQMLQDYTMLAQQFNGTIVVILDHDGHALQADFKHCMRDQDTVLILEAGEIEDTYTSELIVHVVNQGFLPHQPLTLADVHQYQGETQVETLHNIWDFCELGRFDKVAFAQAMVAHPPRQAMLSEAMQAVLQMIVQVDNGD